MTLEELLRQGKSFGQGASNAAASTVTGPVDMLAWLLRKGGVPVGDTPIGGEAWMRQKGLMATPENRLAGLLGEGAGLAAPIVAAAKAPEIAGGLLQMGRNLATPQTLNKQTGAIVYHGSPHKFDKFDSSKIGTGEGAQAYGHGLYLAESPDVAKSYQAMSYNRTVALPDGKGYALFDSATDKKISETFANKDAALKAKEAFSGNHYKVDLPDEHIAKMLDWDKPLSQQHPDVQKAAGDYMRVAPEWSGAQLYNDMVSHLGGQRTVNQGGVGGAVSDKLKKQGIPGIRYLDGGSRSAGAGSSNFVIFPQNEGLLQILERNGKPIK